MIASQMALLALIAARLNALQDKRKKVPAEMVVDAYRFLMQRYAKDLIPEHPDGMMDLVDKVCLHTIEEYKNANNAT